MAITVIDIRTSYLVVLINYKYNSRQLLVINKHYVFIKTFIVLQGNFHKVPVQLAISHDSSKASTYIVTV